MSENKEPPTQPTVEEVVAFLREMDRAIYSGNGTMLKHAIAMLSALEKDAARYRWLRDQRRWLYNLPPTPGISVRWENYIAGPADWLDTAIDLARGAT